MSKQTEKFILDLSYSFALKISSYSEVMEKSRDYDEAGRLFKSGASIGANIREAQTSGNIDSFIYNLYNAVKEAEETENRLLKYKNSEVYPDIHDLLNDIRVMKRFLRDVINSSKSEQFHNNTLAHL